MIKVVFPRGCYGTYLSRCIYNFTNLSDQPFYDFEFGDSGDSHAHRHDIKSQDKITQGHVEDIDIDQSDTVIAVIPCQRHFLDYYSNQFYKQEKGQLINYILTQISQQEAEHKLSTQWGYLGKFNNNVPQWILREWCSFWIDDVLTNSYNSYRYENLLCVAKIFTQDILDNFESTLTRTVACLGLNIKVNLDLVRQQHQKFLSLQRFHNSQIRCEAVVQDLLQNKDSEIKVQNIFEESYIQFLLRQHNLEIQCDGLDKFPLSTANLKKICYEISDHCN